jgi:choline-sulfatase
MTEDRVNQEWRKSVGTPMPPWRPFRDPAREWLNADKKPLPYRVEEMKSSWQVAQAGKWLDEHKAGPFALWLSLQEPHSPFHFPQEEAMRFDPKQFAVPRVGPEDAWQIPNIFRDLTPEEKQGIIAAYYTSAAFLDFNMGRMLGRLERLGLDENTLVVYMADHGYSLGQHGRFEKHCFYEPAMHVPLVFRWKGKLAAGRTVRHWTESVDVATTITDLLGLREQLPKSHGRNLFNGPKRDEIFSIYLENEEACLLWDRWKLIYTTGKRKRDDGYVTDNPTPGKIVRLYDRKADPGEFTNVAAKHPALVETLTRRLEARFAETDPDRSRGLDDALRPRDI